MKRVAAGDLFSPAAIAVQVVKIACNRPERRGRSLSQWDCRERARQLRQEGLVERISPETVHCSWMNQLEQWFSILQRKRFRFADFASKQAMQDAIIQFISEWNQQAHPFNWSTKSAAKVTADTPKNKAA